MIVVGLMSGTSADGVDAAVMRISGAPPQLRWSLVKHHFCEYPGALRAEVLACMAQNATVDRVCALNVALGEFYATATLAAISASGLQPSRVRLIGCHGQTLWHIPAIATLQVGEPAVLAERTGIAVVSNFRSRDIAAGGQGAPLVAYVDELLYRDDYKSRALQNLGGIANVTYVPARIQHRSKSNRAQLKGASAERAGFTLGFDTGPANMLIDDIARRATNGAWQCDHDGAMAAAGAVHGGLLEELLGMPFFAQKPPKTTGREVFGAQLGAQLWDRMRTLRAMPKDLAATLTMLTATSIADAYRDFLPALPDEVILSGGGARNPTLVRMLTACLRSLKSDIAVTTSDALGMPVEAKEAACFALLAYETLHGRPGNLPSATGARKRVVLGDLTSV